MTTEDNKIGFMQGPSGEFSSMRCLMWFLSGVIILIWAWCCISADKGPLLVPIPESVSNIIWYVLVGKVGQSAIVESGAMKAVTSILGKKEP